jgi:hypothetical protein
MRNSKGGLKTCDDCQKEEIEPYDFEPNPWKKVIFIESDGTELKYRNLHAFKFNFATTSI